MSEIVKFNKDNTYQRLRAHYLDPDKNPITDAEKKRYDRVLLLFTLRRNRYSKQSAIKKIMDDYDISQATAYRDYSMMASLYGEVDEVNAVTEMMFIREEYMFLYKRLCEDGDYKEARAVLDKYRETLPPVDENEVDINKIAAHEFHIKMDRQLQKLMKEQLVSGGGMDFSEFNIQDVEFEEIKNDVEESD